MTEHITYKDEKLPVSVSFYALKKVKEETGKSFLSGSEIENDELLDVLEPLLYYGLIAGHEAEDKEFTIKREKVDFILDENFSDFVQMLPKFFKQLTVGGQNAKDLIGSGEKSETELPPEKKR